MKGTKTQNGITLIALIITIVVLMILAVVTIGAVQNSGIITHAENAKNSWETASTQENLKLKFTALKMDMVANPSDYSFMVSFDEENESIIYDDGSINEVLSNVGFTIDSTQLTEDGKVIMNTEDGNIQITSEDTATLRIKCKDENGNDINVYCDLKYAEVEDVGIKFEITEFYSYGELGTTILDINSKLDSNPDDYTVAGTANDTILPALDLLYTTLTNNGITIESEELLNDEKNGWNHEAFTTGEGGVLTLDDYSSSLTWMIYGFDFECSKGGETLTVRAQLRSFDDSTGEGIRIYKLIIK